MYKKLIENGEIPLEVVSNLSYEIDRNLAYDFLIVDKPRTIKLNFITGTPFEEVIETQIMINQRFRDHISKQIIQAYKRYTKDPLLCSA